MRTIEIDTDVFARIWAHRAEGEETENEILRRLLASAKRAAATQSTEPTGPAQGGEVAVVRGKLRWRDDVRSGLEELGGTAALADIYAKVRSIRRRAGRSLPPTTDDIIRRELENNSSDSHAFTGKRDWFTPAEGKGAGIWSIRPNLHSG
jgi:hypothetical protein